MMNYYYVIKRTMQGIAFINFLCQKHISFFTHSLNMHGETRGREIKQNCGEWRRQSETGNTNTNGLVCQAFGSLQRISIQHMTGKTYNRQQMKNFFSREQHFFILSLNIKLHKVREYVIYYGSPLNGFKTAGPMKDGNDIISLFLSLFFYLIFIAFSRHLISLSLYFPLVKREECLQRYEKKEVLVQMIVSNKISQNS